MDLHLTLLLALTITMLGFIVGFALRDTMFARTYVRRTSPPEASETTANKISYDELRDRLLKNGMREEAVGVFVAPRRNTPVAPPELGTLVTPRRASSSLAR